MWLPFSSLFVPVPHRHVDYNMDLFLTSINEHDSQDYVYYFISEFSDMVRYHFNPSELDVDKCIAISRKLEKMLSKYGINGRYIESYSSNFSLMDYNEVVAKLNLSIAIPNVIALVMMSKVIIRTTNERNNIQRQETTTDKQKIRSIVSKVFQNK